MGILDFLSGRGPRSLRGGPIRVKGDDDLFDDEFQRKLDYLAVVSKRVFSGAMRAERRTKKKTGKVVLAIVLLRRQPAALSRAHGVRASRERRMPTSLPA